MLMIQKNKRILSLLIILCVILVFLFSETSGLSIFIKNSKAETQSVNLIENGGFEDVESSGLPKFFYTDSYFFGPGYTNFYVSDSVAHSGNNSICIQNINPNDSRYASIVNVNPNTVYCLEGYILAESTDDTGRGANLSVEGIYDFSESVYNSNDEWKHIKYYGKTGPDQNKITVFARLGGYGGESEGIAYFDDISLTQVAENEIPPAVSMWYEPIEPANDSLSQNEAHAERLLYILFAMLYSLLAFLLIKFLKPIKNTKYLFIFVLLVSAFIRIYLAYNVQGYQVDMGCFTGWSLNMFKLGPAKFYTSGGFCDYPPAYLYTLWGNGALLQNVVSANISQLIVKTVPIICDMLTAIIIYAFAIKKTNEKNAFIVGVLCALNPMIIVTSASWGQIDSVLTLFIVLTLLLAWNGKWQYAMPVFIISALIKPQALMFAPVAVFALIIVIRQQKTKADRKAIYKKILFGIVLMIIAALAIIIPFSVEQNDPMWLVKLYSSTMSSYPYATINTANFYYLLGANWVDQSNTMPLFVWIISSVTIMLPFILGLIKHQKQNSHSFLAKVFTNTGLLFSKEYNIQNKNDYRKSSMYLLSLLCGIGCFIVGVISPSFASFGMFAMVSAFVLVFIFMLSEGSIDSLGFSMALLLLCIYILNVRMHERYLYAAIILLMLDFAKNKHKKSLILAVAASLPMFINIAIVLENSMAFGSSMGHLNDDTLALNYLLAIANISVLIYSLYICFTGLENKDSMQLKKIKTDIKGSEEDKFTSYAQKDLCIAKPGKLNMSLKDYLWIIGTCIIYSVFAFYCLGSTKAPQTAWTSTKSNEQVIFKFDDIEEFETLYYGGINYNGFTLAVSDELGIWSQEYTAELTEGQCFRWIYLNGNENNPLRLEGKYVRITSEYAGLNLNEIIFRDNKENPLPVSIESTFGGVQTVGNNQDPQMLIDEQDTMPDEPGYYNSTYFDEIYHARTAYEHLNGIPPYETSHPPLGKLIMSLGIMLFGMVPFGYRFAGTLAGVLMLPVMYLLAKQLTKNRKIAIAAMLLLAFDCMHLTQTRIATIDSFPVLFIMISYLGMLKYIDMDHFNTHFLKTLIPLLISGVSIGLAIASKWIGLYSGVGLAILFFVSCFKQIRMGIEASKNKEELIERYPQRAKAIENAANNYLSRVILTCIACIPIFIIIPSIIYYLSYIPYFAPTGGISIERVIQTQQNMFDYHSTPMLGADHPYQSPWWQWPLILKPMWYYMGRYEAEGMAATIFCMGNPAVYYIGALCMSLILIAFLTNIFSKNKISNKTNIIPAALGFVAIGFLSQYLPWVLVPRSMFMYHYFASVPFIILAIVLCFKYFIQKGGKYKLFASIFGIILIVVAGAMFIGFYPYASGITVSTKWLDFMKWFPNIWY